MNNTTQPTLAPRLQEIFKLEVGDQVKALTTIPTTIKPWEDLAKEYDPTQHPVMNKTRYPDLIIDGKVEEVTRVPLNFQRLAVNRMTAMVMGIPAKRYYHPEDDKQAQAAKIIERILTKNRISSLNRKRAERLYSSCAIATVWFAVDRPNQYYGVPSPIKISCKVYSPRDGHQLFPLFDDFGDYIALSILSTANRGGKEIKTLETYTDTRYLLYVSEGGSWSLEQEQEIKILKNPTIYLEREEPVWEDTSRLVYEMEWTLSRNGNYIRKNSKPMLVTYADEVLEQYDEQGNPIREQDQDREFRGVFQLPQGAKAEFLTWSQAAESLKFHIQHLQQAFFSALQIPDISYENMKSTPMSGESRKQLFIDAHQKVVSQAGAWEEMLDREIAVVKEFAKMIFPTDSAMREAIDNLNYESEIIPFTIDDDKERISNLITANGGKPIVSQRQAIGLLGWSDDIDTTLAEIKAEESIEQVALQDDYL